jgi:hypothetical protein
MTQSPFKITIPEPCHENWDTMLPNEKGRHCLSCQKTVVDLTAMTDAQIIDYFQKYKGSTCGRFMDTQLKRSIYPPIKPTIHNRWAWLFSTLLLPLSLKAQTPQYNSPIEKSFNAIHDQDETDDKSMSSKKQFKKQEEPITIDLPNVFMGDAILAEPPQSFKTSEEIYLDIFHAIKNWIKSLFSFFKSL